MEYGGFGVYTSNYFSLKRGWRDSTARLMAVQYGVSGKHMKDAEPVRQGKLVDRAKLVRVASHYKSSTEQLLYAATLVSPSEV
jgi:hypothetical protein